jgi:hypothetical protein
MWLVIADFTCQPQLPSASTKTNLLPSSSPDYYDMVRWVNTSAVESCNSFLVRFRTLGWYSELEAFMIILAYLISGRNLELTRVDDAIILIAGRADLWTAAIRHLVMNL